MSWKPAAVALLALTLAGCSATTTQDPEAPPTTTLSAECKAALAAFPDAEPLTDEETAAVTAMAHDCKTVDEFMLGLEDNPDAWGLDPDDDLDLILLSTCSGNEGEPLCVDAAAQGRIE